VKSSSSVGRQNYGTSFQILLWGLARSMLSRERLMIPVRAATACHRRMACFTRPRPRRSFSTTTTTTTVRDIILAPPITFFLDLLGLRFFNCMLVGWNVYSGQNLELLAYLVRFLSLKIWNFVFKIGQNFSSTFIFEI
jgi:hypothetical protein